MEAPDEQVSIAGTRSPGALLSDVPPRRAIVHHWNRLRVLAMFDIASFHLTHEYLFLGIGLPVFLLLTMSLGPSAKVAPEWRVVLQRRLARLAGPWLFWNLALLAFLSFREMRHGEPPFGWTHPFMLFGGVQPHMWFLPFATVAGLLVAFVDRRVRRFSPTAVAACTLPLAALANQVHPNMPYMEPMSQWAFALPSLPLGLGLATLLRAHATVKAAQDVPRRRWNLGIYVLAYVVIVMGMVAAGLDGEGDGRRYALALIVLYLLWLLPNFPDRITTVIEPLLMGVFVLHISMGFTVFFRFVPSGTLPGPVETTVVVVLTAVVVALLRTTKLGRRVL